MCYLVAKWFDRTGSLAMQTEAGPSLVDIMKRIEGRFGSDDLQLVTITRPSASISGMSHLHVLNGRKKRIRIYV